MVLPVNLVYRKSHNSSTKQDHNSLSYHMIKTLLPATYSVLWFACIGPYFMCVMATWSACEPTIDSLINDGEATLHQILTLHFCTPHPTNQNLVFSARNRTSRNETSETSHRPQTSVLTANSSTFFTPDARKGLAHIPTYMHVRIDGHAKTPMSKAWPLQFLVIVLRTRVPHNSHSTFVFKF